MAVFEKVAGEPESVGVILGILGFVAGKIAFGEAEIVYRVQQVGFSDAIGAGDANDAVFEFEGRLLVIFELDQ
jgi:hypothetical protein